MAQVILIFAAAISISNFDISTAVNCHQCEVRPNDPNKLCDRVISCDFENGARVAGIHHPRIAKHCVQFITKARNGSEFVERSCMPNVDGGCKTLLSLWQAKAIISDPNIDQAFCYSCNIDGCNNVYMNVPPNLPDSRGCKVEPPVELPRRKYEEMCLSEGNQQLSTSSGSSTRIDYKFFEFLQITITFLLMNSCFK